MMNKVAVIYWSGTGNTELMAQAVAEGAKQAGAEVSVYPVEQISAQQAAAFDRLALGCPAMGGEVLEECSFEPFFSELEGSLSGKKVVLFGSYDWGDGQWMRDWQSRTEQAGAVLAAEGLIVHLTPDDSGLADCRNLGAQIAQ